jgi:capsular exopolysaccharide synthesis family protein
MSRLYDALKDVNRLEQEGDQEGKPPFWEGGNIDIPPVQVAAETIVPAPPAPANGNRVQSLPEPEIPLIPELSVPVVPEEQTSGVQGVPVAAGLDRRARLIPHATDLAVVEHYRRLRTKILQKREEKPFKTLLVTSASPQEGKSVTVLNLGLSFAMLPDFKVLVVDGDLRRGSLGRWLGVADTQPGLSDVVNGTLRLEDAILRSEKIPMPFIVRGTAHVPDVHASQFEILFQQLAEQFDLVILDSPPVNLLADVQLLASSSHAVLLVARSFVTNRRALEKAARDLESFNVIGTVLNAATEKKSRYYGYY